MWSQLCIHLPKAFAWAKTLGSSRVPHTHIRRSLLIYLYFSPSPLLFLSLPLPLSFFFFFLPISPRLGLFNLILSGNWNDSSVSAWQLTVMVIWASMWHRCRKSGKGKQVHLHVDAPCIKVVAPSQIEKSKVCSARRCNNEIKSEIRRPREWSFQGVSSFALQISRVHREVFLICF